MAGHPEVQTLLDEAVRDGGLPGIVCEIRDPGGRWFGAAGVSDTTTGRHRDPAERFRIGSATKSFTATVLLQLVGEGKLTLDDTVQRWLPGLVAGNGNDGRRITVGQLLDHTSGLFDHTDDDEVRGGEGWKPEQLVRLALNHPPYHPPGLRFRYSNTNYVLAGMLIERVTGLSVAQEVSARISGPLGLAGTYSAGIEQRIRGPHPRHYSTLFDPAPDAEVHDLTELDQTWAGAAGDMVSTTGDLQVFLRALLTGELLPPAQHTRMWTTVSTAGAEWVPHTAYGLGVFTQQLSCGTIVHGIGGATMGSWSWAMGDRTGERVVVVQTNGDWNNPLDLFTTILQTQFTPTPMP
ncbi:serine hydrolase domain-containing protein [Nocardia brasiliensis]|uniref:Alkaline D-peptidase n=1 Tax=Nocardia brasiliensis (strain ATCC 700358 / HUJEG-1) TaxID=1133849 RepID=K0F0Q6_NOCB7|nr:serine hydrolase domain-containing protein [Nocardia brasiliensis]AFU05778.1 alkaline D-peptidase [Nocardia brasiliensis ATCC 700358]OCF89959.1 alkaline D-peptidase [Nocardia brasiliensis]